MRQATELRISPSPASPVLVTVKDALPRARHCPLISRLERSQTSVAVGVMVGVLVGVNVGVKVGVFVGVLVGRWEQNPVTLRLTKDRKLVR